ncbi:hypothetical protein K402DRAFT_351281 [Aulographum hederae CBS 113979]|uniref:Uncharacterized protein n=1 Tax=Aulographum hederae CBS 113979 TaxID=1176131 RepID=A0A6G1H6F8_9PEZI|nr:hypothetical protein K402DRAFT_351281 [Aulographum hederae CBS 113979]
MVLFSMTPVIEAAVERYNHEREIGQAESEEPSLDQPTVGNPISHGQLIDISNHFKEHSRKSEETSGDGTLISYHLNDLLRGTRIYVPPPKPKPEPTSEYKALMARLRVEEEARSYERMLNPVSQPESFSQRFPSAAYHNDLLARQNAEIAVSQEDDVTYAEINRQLALIVNVLVSIIACSYALWMVGRYWSTPARLALAMGGSILVAVAEVVIYSGYIRRVGEAKEVEKKKVEEKEVFDTWIIDAKKGGEKVGQVVGEVLGMDPADGLRLRKGK